MSIAYFSGYTGICFKGIISALDSQPRIRCVGRKIGRSVHPAGPRVVEPGRVGGRVERPVGLRHQQPPVVLERLVQLPADGHVLLGHVVGLARVGHQVEQARLACRTRRRGTRSRRRRVAPDCRLVPHGQQLADVAHWSKAGGGERQRVRELGDRAAGRAVQNRGCVIRGPRSGRPVEPVQ